MQAKPQGLTKWIGIGLVLATTIAAVWILFGRMSAGPSAAPADELRIPILATSALQTLDPIKSAELVQYNLDQQIFECLVSVNASGAIVPALADKWKSSSNYKVWTFHLRDARFSDDPSFPEGKGRRVTAADVIYSWERGLMPNRMVRNSNPLSGRGYLAHYGLF